MGIILDNDVFDIGEVIEVYSELLIAKGCLLGA